MLPEVGDKITIMARGTIVQTRIVRVDREGVLVWVVHRGGSSWSRSDRAEEEGVWWIRGHHAEDSPEVIGLKAANALVAPQFFDH